LARAPFLEPASVDVCFLETKLGLTRCCGGQKFELPTNMHIRPKNVG